MSIKLYKCKNNCGRVLVDEDFKKERPCCGAGMFHEAQATWYNIVRFFLGHPKYLKQAIKEGVTRASPPPEPKVRPNVERAR